jgi:predicted  nucleic acid-binding Zn-ribbon protein
VGIATFVLALGSGLAVVKAAQGSLPGDRLFPVKLALERAELGITFDQAAKTKLQGEITGKRADELTEVAKLPFSLNERKMAQAIDQIEQQIADTQKNLPGLKDRARAGGGSQEEVAAAMRSMQENTAKLKMAIEQAKKISEISENKALSSKISDISDKLDKAHSEISEIIDTLEETRGDAQKQEQDENSTTAPRVVP